MKINKLDLAKVISDFMFLGIENPEEKAKVVFRVKHQLTAHWFEKYMQYYFEKIKKYKVKLNWNTYEFDWGIDLKWIKRVNWENHYLIAQCKKYSIKDITEEQIKSYHGSTFHKYMEYKDQTDSYYITTSKFTDKAKIFAKETHIKAVDFSDIYNLQKVYSIEKFKKDLEVDEWIEAVNKSFNNEQLLLELDNHIYETEWVSNSDVFQLLRQIRRDYSNYSQLRLWDIAKNDTLKLLADKRPHNLQVLKETVSHLSTREQNKIKKHWEIFIERLKYIHNEDDKIAEEFEKWFFNKLVEFIK